MEDLLISTLETFKIPVKRQGSMLKNEEYSNSFFTFWNNSSDGENFYDNNESKRVWNFDVNIYSTEPNLVYSLLVEAKRKLKNAGFIISGKGYDVASDESTHTGRGMNVLYLEREEN